MHRLTDTDMFIHTLVWQTKEMREMDGVHRGNAEHFLGAT